MKINARTSQPSSQSRYATAARDIPCNSKNSSQYLENEENLSFSSWNGTDLTKDVELDKDKLTYEKICNNQELSKEDTKDSEVKIYNCCAIR